MRRYRAIFAALFAVLLTLSVPASAIATPEEENTTVVEDGETPDPEQSPAPEADTDPPAQDGVPTPQPQDAETPPQPEADEPTAEPLPAPTQDPVEDSEQEQAEAASEPASTALVTKKRIPHRHGPYASFYDLYVGAIDRTKPVGVLFYFDADTTNPRNFRYLNNALMARLTAIAANHNLVFVAVHTPGGAGKHGLYNWWDRRDKGAYARNVAATVVNRYGLDSAQVWFSGWSGGAELITKELMSMNQTWFTGGGAIMMGGGEAEFGVRTPSPAVRQMRMRWYIGDRDGYGATLPPTWSARVAAQRGLATYRRAGFIDTALIELPNQNHFYNVAALIDRGLSNIDEQASDSPVSVRGDLVAVDGAGTLWNYHGHRGRLGNRSAIGTRWGGFVYHEQTDWNQDGVMDILAQHQDGRLLIYRGKRTGGYLPPAQIGHGFQEFRIFSGTTCTSCAPSLFGIDADGRMFRWSNNGTRYVSQRTQIGWKWDVMDHIMPVEWTSNGQVDIAAIDGDGTMWLYRLQDGRFRGGKFAIGRKWNFEAVISLPGFQGRNALIAKDETGVLHAYPYAHGRFTVEGRGVVGTGWSDYLIAAEH